MPDWFGMKIGASCVKYANFAIHHMQADPNDILIQKLDAFIRKYYKNRVIRGVIYSATLILLTWLSAVALEYFGRFNSVVRAALLYGVVITTTALIAWYVILPLMHLWRIGKIIGYDEASKLVGRHFPDVSDKLLNTLQLKQYSETSGSALLRAAIEQKTAELKPIPFTSAIDLKKNIRLARYMIIPLMLYLAVFLVAPGMISDGTKRVWQYDRQFAVPAPFAFHIINKDLQAEQYSDFTVEMEVSGEQLPKEVYLVLDGNRFKMSSPETARFNYTIHGVRRHTPFVFEAAGFTSEPYLLKIITRPHLEHMVVHATFPKYLNRKPEKWENPGDMNIPAGTTLEWDLHTRSADSLWLGFNDRLFASEKVEANLFRYRKKLFMPARYFLKAIKGTAVQADSLNYMIQVVPDAYPTVTLDEQTDSLMPNLRYFMGDASDDYGISKITFNYRFLSSASKEREKQGVVFQPIPVMPNSKNQRFNHQVNLHDLGVQPSDQVEYYFEVWDNDGVFGSKATRSAVMTYKAPTEKELQQQSEQGSSALKQKMEEVIRESRSLQKELKSLETKMLENRELTWEEKKKLDNLMKRHEELSKHLEEIKQQQQELNRQEQEFKREQENLIEKQDQINKLFNELMTDDMKKMLKQLEQLMQQQNKDAIREEMEKLQLGNKDIEKELDRMLEQFKELELDKKREEAIKKMDALSQKQEELGKRSEQLDKTKSESRESRKEQISDIKREQQKLSEEFHGIKDDLKNIEQKNAELEQPKQLQSNEEDQQEIEQNQQESEKDLGDEKPGSASSKQKKAAGKMKEMSDRMKKELEAGEKEQDELNAEALREILENTLQLSKDQEKLMEDFKRVSNYNPQYVEMARQQKTVKDNARMIEDSLLSLSKRVPEISTFINREVSKLNANLAKSLEGFGSRNIGQIRLSQQQAMMNANNLGLMLSEVLKQLQDQMQSNSSGQQGKKKQKGKGKGKGKSMGSMKQMQEELNKQLREGLNKQEGKQQNPGNNSGPGSKEYARMAAQQMAIRQQMQQLLNQMGNKEKEQLGGQEKLRELQRMMEQTEKELFNKNLSRQMLMRQQEILTRLLESEKAERKQEEEKKRESEQAREKPRTAPPSFDAYQKQKQKELELLQTIPAEMQPYYKEKTRSYFGKFQP